MKIKVILFSSFLFLANAAFAETKLDPESAKIVKLLKAMFSKEGLFGEIKPSPSPSADVLDPTPLPHNLASSDLENALTLFSKSFYLQEFMGSASIESDTFLLPNGAYTKISTEWTSIKTLSGKEVRGAKSKDEDMMLFAKIPLAGYSDKDPLYEAKGVSQLRLPVKFLRVDLSKKNLSQAVVSGDFEVTLDSLENDVTKVRIKNKKGSNLEGVAVLPLGAKGRLKTRETSDRSLLGPMPDFVAEAIADLESGKKKAPQINKEFSERRKDLEKTEKKDERLYSARALGVVTGVAVFIPTEVAERKLETSAFAEPKIEDAKPDVIRSTRYLNSTPPVFRKMSVDELKKETLVKADRSTALFTFNTPMIVCVLPDALNGEYGSIEFVKPKLLNKGGAPVPFELETGIYNSESHSLEIRFNPKSGKNPVVFEKATGSIHIKYPVRITTTSVKKGQGGDHLLASFNGRFIKVDSTRMAKPESFFAKIKPVRAYDGTGRELAPLSYSSTSSGTEGHFETFAFWGEPIRADIDNIEEWAEFDIPYDLAPSKEMPKPDLGGMGK